MKFLNPDGNTIIPSNLPRTNRGRDSRGIRLLAQEIGRSCSLNQGYIIFQDGSAYVYDAPSREAFQDLCASPHRGKQFNLGVRRAMEGYTRGFTPPADYEVIYEYPPYEGSAPGICTTCGGKTVDWNVETWDLASFGGPASQTGGGDDVTLVFGNVTSATLTSHDFCAETVYTITMDVDFTLTATANAIGVFWNGAVVFVDLTISGHHTGTFTFDTVVGDNQLLFGVQNSGGDGTFNVKLSPATAP